MQTIFKEVTKKGVIEVEARLESLREREEVLSRARGYLEDAAEELEEVMPSVSEEISWIAENVIEEIVKTQSRENYLADGVAYCDL